MGDRAAVIALSVETDLSPDAVAQYAAENDFPDIRRLAATTRRRIVTWDGERQTRRAAAKAARAVLDGRGPVAPARPDGATTRPLDSRGGTTDGSHAGGGDA